MSIEIYSSMELSELCFSSCFDFWDNMVKGSAPIQMIMKGLCEELWREKEKLALAWLEDSLPTLNKQLTSDAWLGVK